LIGNNTRVRDNCHREWCLKPRRRRYESSL
jgi:hypothetical protein